MLIWLLISCQQELKSPSITVEGSDPNIACNSQLTTPLTITGSQFSPLPVGVLTDNPSLTPVRLWLQRTLPVVGGDLISDDTGGDTLVVDADITFELTEWTDWTDANTLNVDIRPEFNIPSGTYAIHVENPDGQTAQVDDAITIVDAPLFSDVDPLMVCVDGRSQNFTLSGETLLVGETQPVLALEENGETFELSPVLENDCQELNGVTTTEMCDSLEFSLEDGTLSPGLHQGWLTNPDPAACTTEVPMVIEAVERPHLDEVIANFECVQQGEQQITLNGTDFVVLADGTTPMVSFGDFEARADEIHGCEPLLGAAQAQTCTQLILTLPEDVQDPGVYAVTVTNPAPVDCESSETVEIELLPTPSVTTLSEQLECSDQADQTMSVEGTGFLRLEDGTTPTIQVGSSVYDTTLDNCTPLTGPQGGETCTSLEFILPLDSEIGVHDVVVVNPNSSECVSEEVVQMEVVGQPTITSITEQLESIEQLDQSMHITGYNFVVLADGTLPSLSLSGNPVSNIAMSGCTPLTGPLGGETCTDIDFTLTANSLAVDIYDVEIVNPQSADCASEEAPQVELIGRPVVNAVSQDWSCLEQGDQVITLSGANFLRTHTQTVPTVSVGTYTTPALDLRDCVDLNGPMGGVLCSTLDFVLPVGAEVSGAHSIVVNNPDTAEAYSEESHDLEITSTPTLAAVAQNVECIDQSDKTLTISGSQFVVLADGTTPVVTIGNQQFSADQGQNCSPLAGTQGGETCTELLLTLPQDVQPAGVYDITVQNPFEQTCTSTDTLSYELIAQPTVASISEGVDCLDETSRSFTLTGTGFYQDGSGQNPEISLGGTTVVADTLSNCTTLNGPAGGQVCTTLDFTLAQNAVVTGVHNITVQNPSNTCSTEEVLSLETIPAPTITEVLDSMECLAESEQDIVIAGTNFYIPADGGYPTVEIDGQTETVTFASDCTPLLNNDGQLCDTLHVTLSANAYAAGAHSVQVRNIEPAQCSSATSPLNVAEAPVLNTVQPLSACLDEMAQSIALNGQHFIHNTTTGAEPIVEILGSEFALDALSNCTTSSLDGNFESCTDLSFTLDVGSLPAGNHTLTLNNPEPADCSATISSVEIFESPTLSGASASLSCIDQEDVEITLYGADFVEINGVLPTVDVGTFSTTPTSMDGCTTPSNSVASRRCTQMSLIVPAASLAGGSYNISVTNPAGAECSSSQAVNIDLVGAPVITDVRPTTACYESPNTISVEIIGINFVQLADGTIPTVQMGSETLTPTSLDNCNPYGQTGANLCTSIFVDLDLNNYNSAASLPVQILNPQQIGCNSNANFTFDLTGPPTITSVDPNQVCDDGRTFTLTGTDFTNTSIIEVDGVEVPSTFVDTEHIEVNLPADFGEGIYDIRIINVDQCEGSATNAVEVVSSPLPFFVDPPVIYNGINLQVTLYASDINDDVSTVIIEDSSGTQTTVSFTYDPADPNRVRFTVPAGLPSDTYSVYLEDILQCGDTLAGAFFIEDALTVNIESIDPAFGSTIDYTTVEVTSDGTAGDTFQDVPRLYLNPTGSGLATELFGINYQNPELLDAIIPSGLTIGTYDLVAVNPDGGIGLLPNAVEVIDESLPLVSGISPGSFDTSHDGALTVLGENLDLASASLECRAGLNGTPFTVPATVQSSSNTSAQIVVDMNANGISGGLVCIVDVVNNSGALARFSSLSITTPSGNLDQFYAGPPMLQARRGAPSAVGRASYSARYLYVMGGDQGSTGTIGGGQGFVNQVSALDSVEYAQVNRYGELQNWQYLPTTLPTPRSLTTSVTIGRYIYLPGGNDGGNAIAAVHRAQILDPLESPRISNVDLNLDNASTLEAGTWIYRVSALYPNSYDDNPGGESLPSDPFVIRIPDLGQGLSVSLNWNPAANADGYAIYRSPAADAASGDEELLAVVGNVTEYTDFGGNTTTSATPLPKGALGEWAPLPDMNSARESACIATARHPSDPNIHYVYVAGGVDDNGAYLDSVEFLEVTQVSEHDHEVSASWTINNLSLDTARTECGSFVVDNESNQYLNSDEVYVYFGPGTNANGGVASIMEAGRVSADGQLAYTGQTNTLYTVSSDFSYRGYFYGTAGGYLYAFGGSTANQIRNTGQSAQLCGPSDAFGGQICNNDVLPDTSNWNNLGISLSQKRYLPSVTQESSIFFILGGESDSAPATNTVEWIYY